ncbi:MAG: response regulator [bacterium]|nr:response regulator [bacterium]
MGLSWFLLDRADRQRVSEETRITSEQVALRLTAWIDFRANAIRELGFFVQRDGAATEASFRAEALRLIAANPGFQALNWVDADGIIRIIAPQEGNTPALGGNLRTHQRTAVRDALAKTERGGELSRTPVIDLYQGGTGFATYLAIRDKSGALIGFINGVFRWDALVERCLSEPGMRQGFRYKLVDADGTIAYAHEARKPAEDWPFRRRLHTQVVDAPMVLELAPTDAHVSASRNFANQLVLIVGLASVALLFWLLYGYLVRREALRASEARYRSLITDVLDASPVGVVVTDGAGKIVWFNRAQADLFDMERSRFLGRDLLETVDAHMSDGVLSRPGRFMERMRGDHTGAAATFQLLKSENRAERWVEHRSAQIDAGLFAGGRIHQFLDVTRRITAEAGLRQAQKMEAVGKLAGGVAHDFNNLLQVIMGRVSVLEVDDGTLEERQEAAAEIMEASNRAAALTKQLLAFGRRQVLQRRVLDLNALVREHTRMLRRLISEDVRLHLELDGATGYVRADPTQIEQVLMNLCVNARDAMPDGGRLTIRTRGPIETTSGESVGGKPEFVTLEVADEGIGIPAKDLEQVFEPFFSTKHAAHGSGLGLSTVYGIVEQHGGRTDIESLPGHGTTVRVMLPASDAAPEAPTPAPPRERQQGSARAATILVAEDDPGVRLICERILLAANYRVVVAEDGRRALDIWLERRDEVDLVFTDIVMPHLGGPALAAKLREHGSTAPVLFMTGHAADNLDAVATASVIRKPFSRDDLLTRIRAMLDAPASIN